MLKKIFYKENFIDFFKKNLVYLLSFFIPLLLWLIIFIIKGFEPFGNNTLLTNDGIHQYYPFLSLYREKLVNMKSLLYSFSGGLGFDFYTLWAYYLASPLNLLIVLFPAEYLSAVLNLLIVIKICFCGFSFSYYLGSHGEKKDLKIVIFACGYALSSFILGYNFNIMWIDAIAIFPIILVGLEKLLKENKWKLYTFSLFISIWCNFYISFMICVFLVIWFLFYEFKSIKDFFKKGIRFAAFSLLGASLSAVILIPAYIGTSQLSTNSSIPDFIYMANFTDIFMSDSGGGIFAFQIPIKVTIQSYRANLYCGICALGLLLLYFINSRIKLSRRIKSLLLLIIFILSLNNEFLNYIWHGFRAQRGIPNRFVFLLIFFVLILSYTSLRDIKIFAWWQIFLSGITVLGVFGLLYYFKGNDFDVSLIMPSVALVIGYTILEIFININWLSKNIASIVFLLIMCCELVLNMYTSTKDAYGLKEYFRYSADVQAAKDSLGNTLYRAEMSNPIIYNEGMAYGLNGTGMFNTMAKVNVENSLKGLGYSTASSRYVYGTGNPIINTLFGIKNILHFTEDANRLEERYSLINTIGQVQVYENPNVLPIGYMVNSEAANWNDLQSDVFQNQMDLLKLMTGNDYAVFDKLTYELAEANDIRVDRTTAHEFEYFGCTVKRKDNIVFKTTLSQAKDIYIFIEGSLEKNLQVKINDTIIADKIIRNQYYHVGQVQAGDILTINIGINPEDITYSNMFLDIFSYNKSEMDRAYADLSKEVLQVTSFNERHIKGTITSSSDRILFTTIPFDKGWSVKIDGQKVETKAAAAFLSVDLTAGTHTVELTYTSKGLILGIVISIISLILIILISIIKKVRPNKLKPVA